MIFLLKLYQKLKPWNNQCRYYPSCSQYMIDAIVKHGSIFGIIKGIIRVLRCSQLFKGGFDPVA